MPTLITAHAGADGTQANTLQSLEQLLTGGADVVEVDVRREGGRLVLSHDRPKAGETPPLLKEALGLLAQTTGPRLNLDVKTAGLAEEVMALAAEAGVLDRLVFTGDVGEEDLAPIRANRVPLWYNFYLLPREQWSEAHKAVLLRGFEILNIDYRAVNDQMLADAAGRLAVWTVDDEPGLRRLLKAQVRNITTNQPRLALRLREEQRLLNKRPL